MLMASVVDSTAAVGDDAGRPALERGVEDTSPSSVATANDTDFLMRPLAVSEGEALIETGAGETRELRFLSAEFGIDVGVTSG
jgi:hypothetical protein